MAARRQKEKPRERREGNSETQHKKMEGLDNECTTKNPTTKAEGIDLSVLNEQKRRRGKIKRGLE